MNSTKHTSLWHIEELFLNGKHMGFFLPTIKNSLWDTNYWLLISLLICLVYVFEEQDDCRFVLLIKYVQISEIVFSLVSLACRQDMRLCIGAGLLDACVVFAGTYKWQNPEGPLMPCSWVHLWIPSLIQIENRIGWIPGCILIFLDWPLQRSADFHQLRICGGWRLPICSAASMGWSHQQSLPTMLEFWPIHQCPQGDKSDRG